MTLAYISRLIGGLYALIMLIYRATVVLMLLYYNLREDQVKYEYSLYR